MLQRALRTSLSKRFSSVQALAARKLQFWAMCISGSHNARQGSHHSRRPIHAKRADEMAHHEEQRCQCSHPGLQSGTHPMHRLLGMCKTFEFDRLGSLVYARSMLCIMLGRSDFNSLVHHLQTCMTYVTLLNSWRLQRQGHFDQIPHHGRQTVSSMLAGTVAQHHARGLTSKVIRMVHKVAC